MKNKADKCKKLMDIPLLFYSSIHSISSANFFTIEKSKCENFNFALLLSLSHITKKKLYGVCKYCTHRTTVLLLKIFLFWSGAACELQRASYGLETDSKNASHSHWALLRLLLHNLGVGCVVRPCPHY